MVRTQIYLTEEERQGLAAISAETGKTQSEVIRGAVDRLLDEHRGADRLSLLQPARGIWRDREDLRSSSLDAQPPYLRS
jgi:hypothetical protein